MERFVSRRRHDVPQFEPIFAALEADQGYVSRSLYMFAQDPLLIKAVGSMHEAAWYGTVLDEATRDFAAYCFCMFRSAAYSAAHCAANSERHGLPRSTIVSILNAADSAEYTPREKAVIAFCRAASALPAQIGSEVRAGLSGHFSDAEVLALTALLAMMSFLTTWNAIVGTTLEPVPRHYAETVLAPMGWKIGQHGGDHDPV